ncbi:MAG: hypothetical protein CR991_08270 [Proteobacteria bacterium]|nr:MAG: hypothetical protein CR991_08270 [Pseudomonadota bacterium]
MSSSIVETLIGYLNTMPPEMVWGLLLITCFTTVILLDKLFGYVGLYIYIAVAIISANIQVLKAVKFSIYTDPVALGTILFASTYLASDILSEKYGTKIARQAIWLGFSAFFLFAVLMIITLGFSPLTEQQAGEAMAWALPYHGHIAALFTPQMNFLLAGMLAYLVSQMNDIWLFDKLRQKTQRRYLWLRNNVSTLVSSFIDNVVFSVFAWIVLASEPLPWQTVIVTYILGTYWLRLIIAVLDTPFIYLACTDAPVTATS